ncbi:MAG: hypothetical protein NTW21_37755 [Verrucomicrobia bacterium]|nr:hypothetical protein [Verrucomicrobiota bacterium]
MLSRPTATASVNWNSNPPGTVEFWADGVLIGTRTGSGPSYSLAMPVDTCFFPSAGPHQVKVVAKPVAPEKWSDPKLLEVQVVSLPYFLRNLLSAAETGPGTLAVDFSFPVKSQTVTLPVLGKYGCEFALGGSFDYTIEDGSWELGLGVSADGKPKGKPGRRPTLPGLTRYAKPKLYIGNQVIEGSLYGVASGSSLMDPFVIDQFAVDLAVGWKGELTRYSVADALLPGLTTALSFAPGADELLKNFSIILWLKVDGEGVVGFKPVWPVEFQEATLEANVGLEAAYEPKISENLKAKIYVGGEGSLKVGVPAPIFREAGFKVYGGVSVEAWVFTIEREWVLLEYTWTPSGSPSPSAMHDTGTGYLIEAAGNRSATWKPMARPWREQGGEVFLPQAADPNLDVFARMGKIPSPSVSQVPAAGPSRLIVSDPALPAQSGLPLLQNVFPNSEPALAALANTQMLLYVRDTGAADPIHFTEIAWTRFDGTTWSTPAALAADPRGQFAPRVAFDGNGAAVAVWERIKDAAFSTADVGLAAAQMELVTAKWNPATGTWGAASALTENTWLDHDPQLAGPLTDGDLLLTWRENRSNLLIGSGAAGSADNSSVLTRRWDAATATWGAVQVLVADLTGEQSCALAAAGNKAVLLLSRDLDGDFATTSDTELFHRVWNEAASTWSALTRHTTDAIADRNAKVALDASGQSYALWQRGDELVMDRDLTGTPVAVRADAATAGFSDFALTLSPGGNVVALWQEMTDFGSEAHYRVFDPASNTWGLDTLLSQDSDLERSFATAWDATGNLVLAYDNVTVTKQTMTVVLDGGGTVTVDGVPQPGRVDLFLAKRALVKDLTLSANGLTASGTTFLPGDAITLKARVKNSGNVAVQDVAVAFYNGDPAAGGSLLQAVTVPGWLKAADEAEVTANWTIPAPAIARTIFATVDPAGGVTESDETNNTLSLPLNGVNLQLEYGSGSVLRDGSARVVARVKNLSAPEAPVTMLRLKQQDATTTLAEINVSQLAPGDSVEIPLDLPAGTQPEGTRAYRLTVDEEALAGDIDPTNNEVLFSLNLWIDDDGDGIPHEWEVANGMSDSNAADAALDADGDGFSNKQEYLAATDPRDAASYLRIGEVAQQSLAAGGGVAISWASVAGRRYNLERSYDLSHWVVFSANVEGTPPLNTVTDTEVAPSAKAFYRLVVLGE